MTRVISNRCRHLILIWMLIFAMAAASACSHGGSTPPDTDPGDNHPQDVDWQEIVIGNRGKISIVTASYTDGSLSRGEGFFVGNNIVVTTYDRVRLHAGAALLYDIIITLPDGSELNVLGVDFSQKNRNIAFLRVAGQDIAPVSPGNFDTASVSDDIIHIGMPQPSSWTENPGLITATGQIMDVADIDGMDADTEIIQHDATCDPGSNGGMILDTAGEVIAILFSGSGGGNQFCTGISMNYVISAVNTLSFNTIRDELLSGCTENILEGDFIISGFDDLSGFDALSQVTSVTGNVEILYLQDLDFNRLGGVGCLQTIGGSLIIDDNDIITHINAFQNLVDVGGDLVIESHHRLKDLKGLRNLQSVGGNLIVMGNEALDLVENFENLAIIGGGLEIIDNDLLPSLDIFTGPALTELSGDLVIQENPAIVNLEGLDHLTSIDGNLTVQDNEGLLSLEHLNSLVSITGGLVIDHNAALSDMGLSGLSAVGGDFSISDNYQLCTDRAEGLRDQVGEENIGGTVKISHNKACAP